MEKNEATHNSTAKEIGGSIMTNIPKDLREFLDGIPREQPLQWIGKKRKDGKKYLSLWKKPKEETK